MHKHVKEHFFSKFWNTLNFETLWKRNSVCTVPCFRALLPFIWDCCPWMGRKVIAILGPLKFLAPLCRMLLSEYLMLCRLLLSVGFAVYLVCRMCSLVLIVLTNVLLHCQKLFWNSPCELLLFLLLSKSSGIWEFEWAHC